jgi:purine-binding chemotaxis protein CheW
VEDDEKIARYLASDQMEAASQLFVFTLEGCRYALRLSAVERVVRAVEITPLPKAPEIVLGIVNMHGSIVPVVNVRRRFRLPDREIDPGDQLILANTSRWRVALLADSVNGVVECLKQDVISAQRLPPGVKYVEGVVKLEDGMVLIHNLETFLSLDEAKGLDKALNEPGK